MTTESVHLVCPNCAATNRIPQARLTESPKCGKCQHQLLTAKPVMLTDQTAHKTIQKNDVLTIVDFWASWCQPCHMMAPQFEQAAAQLPNVVFAKLQTDQFEQAAAPYGIRSLPTMVAFKGGKEIARQSGALPVNQIVQWVQSLQ
ncbi:thioredoxin TrxC [Psychrobacter sp. FDAARGOS_221]|uniref:thioredoxin TrxC n=1 Tax=Psychrobacter sp. FDAARGOS_221 TaxID=1975705 RepID=UPI000BB560DA|nr:thioredoxin TrxC [Psychrobacter sp. FDAARGOS_221]PNK60909.1 thioredoxin TrxC [Psychrobacter sp. FDAARGOS_221]